MKSSINKMKCLAQLTAGVLNGPQVSQCTRDSGDSFAGGGYSPLVGFVMFPIK